MNRYSTRMLLCAVLLPGVALALSGGGLLSAPAASPGSKDMHAGDAAGKSAAAGSAAAAFEHFKTLAGDWTGKSAGGGTVRASYEVVSGGSAVVERLDMEGEGQPDMITVFHLDGDRLMMTHYCGAGNQPRMMARFITPQEVRFEFLDATSLASPDDGHMHRAVFRFPARDRLTAEWTWRAKGKDASPEVITLGRAAGAPGSSGS